MLLPALRIGPYELLERIGVGGMAEVFRARQTGADGFERFVAIKRILPGIAADHDFVEMFIDEAKIAVQLSHPNIAQIYDLGMEDGVYFIAQEYVHGRDMGAIVERQKAAGVPLPIPFVVHIGMKVCEALQHAHTAVGPGGQPLRIIHRDVSPSNVLVSYEGAVKVIDFGLAKAQGRLATTQVGVVKGKLAYLSPEQAKGRPIDSRSDLFSLGTCMFEWLTGQRLFLRANDVDTVMAIQRAEVPPLRALRPEVPPKLQAIVLKALAPDPDRRYPAAAEMAEELLAFSYEARMSTRRATLGDYVQTLFPEDFTQDWAEPTDPRPRRDTVPSSPTVDVDLLPTADLDLLAPEPDSARPSWTTREDDEPRTTPLDRDAAATSLPGPIAGDRVTRELLPLESVGARAATGNIDDIDDIDDIDEESFEALPPDAHAFDDDFEPTRTHLPRGSTREILTRTDVRFDDATADLRREAVELAQHMDGFEDVTAPGGELGRSMLSAFDEDEKTAAISEEVLREALEKARTPTDAAPGDDEAGQAAPPEDAFDISDETRLEPLAGDDTNPEFDLNDS